MPNRLSFSTIRDKVKKYMEDYSLDDLTYAFEYLMLETILGLNEDEISDAITDGSMDEGIDAIHCIGNEVHIFNFKYAETFENSTNNFPATEIDKIVVTIDRIVNGQIKEGDVNDALWDKILEILDLLDRGVIKIKIHLCSNKEQPTELAKRKLETSLRKFGDIECFYYDQEDLVSKMIEKKFKKVDGKIRFIDRQFFERSDGYLRGIVATVSAIDLVDLVKDPVNSDQINEDAFNENARGFLKLSNKINRGIYESALSENNIEFWYLNNGITLICEACTYMPSSRSPVASLSNFQIVNGGQTTHTLFEAFKTKKECLDSVLLLIRICETREPGIAEKISESTNTQNPIRTRDLHSNDPIQKRLEEQFGILGYFYERKKNQFENEPKGKRLDNEILGQVYLAYYLDMPSEAKNSKSLIFGDKYDDIFNMDDTTAQRLLIPYRVYQPLEKMKKEIQKRKRRKEGVDEKDAFISRATFHILNVVKIVSENESIDLNTDRGVNQAIKKAIRLVASIVQIESKKRGDLYTHDRFFKEVSTNKTIKDFVLSKYC
jgi:hypothetical protein